MALIDAYLAQTKNLDAILKAIRGAQAPEKFTVRFLEQLEFKSTNDRNIIGVLKRLSRLPWEFGLRPGNGRPLYAAASFLSSSVAIALINCGS